MRDAWKTLALAFAAVIFYASPVSAQNVWTDRTAGAGLGGILNGVTFGPGGGGRFVTVGETGVVGVIASSPDGITWTDHTSAASIGGNLKAVTFGAGGGGRFVAVGLTSVTGVIASSPDGASWTNHTATAGVGGNLMGVTFGAGGGGRFVAVGETGVTGVIASSPDGATWVNHTATAGVGGNLKAVAFGAGLFVAVGTNQAAAVIATSPDGVTWTDRTGAVGIGGILNGITFADGQFVAVGTETVNGIVLTSPDGINWTNQTGNAGIGGILRGVAFDSGNFVAVGRTGGPGIIEVSPDAITWASRTAQANAPGDLNGVANGNNTWVAVGSNMVTGVVMTSVATPDLVLSPASLNFGEILSTGTSTLSVTLANPGDGTVTVSALGASPPFTVAPFASTPLAPGASMTIDVTFTPGMAGNFSANLPITRAPAVGVADIPCEGSARLPVPQLTVRPGSLNFGTTNVGTPVTQTFTIESTGDLPVTVAAVTPPGAPFTLTPPAGFVPVVPIPPGTPPFTFSVVFDPAAAGPFSDTVMFVSDDPANSPHTVTLVGEGHVPSAEFVIDPTLTNLDYGGVEAGYRFGKGVRIQNQGDLDLTFDVEVVGDSRFGFTRTPNVPGPGMQAQQNITIPASSGPPFNDEILRVTFDATLPVGGPYSGTLRISGITNDSTPPMQPVDIALEGSVEPAKSVDIALVLDRSGSMSQSTLVQTKEAAVRAASRLFIELLRPDVGDRVSLVQFDDIVEVFKPLEALTVANRMDFVNALNPPNLVPRGATSIAGGLYEAFEELNDPAFSPFNQVRAAFVVSDGEDNTAYQTPSGQVDLNSISVPAGIGVHALVLGTAANRDLAKLAAIAQRTGGGAQASDDTTQLGVFDIEKFFLQTATTILNGMTTVDPVDRIYPGQRRTWQVELIPADKAVTFVLMFKEGALPFSVTAPDGTVYPVGAPPQGFGQSLSEPPKARILRIQLPAHDPSRYAGIWTIDVMHGGKLVVGEGDNRHTITKKDPVDYAFAVSVFSDLRLLGLVSPQPLDSGDPITVTAFLTEEETAVTGATVDVTVRFPDGVSTQQIQLLDDGQHNDGAANDGEYAADFTQTNQAGAYQFAYHAFGQSARGGNFVRETLLSQYVLTPGDDTTPGDPRTGVLEECCNLIVRWLRIIAVIGLLILLVLLWRRSFGVTATTSQSSVGN